ncbi:MAG: peptidoglycan-associated lipoprotein [Pseudohongiellaceae bacterium]|jgi:peptidoglycan-associated lipoprotein
MNISQITRLALLLVSLTAFAACSSTSDEAAAEDTQEVAESGIEGTTRRAREQAEAAEARAAEAAERVMLAALDTKVFYFEFDIAEFRAADRDVLSFHAQALAADSSKRVRLEGHADERGTREYNLALGERRATAILNYLIVNGASRSQIEVVSYGEEQPAQRGTGESTYQQNRRVELVAP